MGARVAFLTTEPAGGAPAPAPAVLIPADAVRGDGTAATVFVYANDHVERRALTLGQAVGTEREVVAGLRPGERVVVSPPPSLADGDAVRVAEGAK
jgi:hypothetical protein